MSKIKFNSLKDANDFVELVNYSYMHRLLPLAGKMNIEELEGYFYIEYFEQLKEFITDQEIIEG